MKLNFHNTNVAIVDLIDIKYIKYREQSDRKKVGIVIGVRHKRSVEFH